MDLEKVSEEVERLKKFSPSEIDYVIRNISYYLVSYYNEYDKGPIYDGSYDSLQIEQATRLQQSISGMSNCMKQVFDHRNFDNDYFEDIISNNYYSKYISAQNKANEYKDKADRYDDLCD